MKVSEKIQTTRYNVLKKISDYLMAGSNYSINFAYKNFKIKGVQRGNIEIKISRSMAKKYDEVFENATDIYHQGDC